MKFAETKLSVENDKTTLERKFIKGKLQNLLSRFPSAKIRVKIVVFFGGGVDGVTIKALINDFDLLQGRREEIKSSRISSFHDEL